jgi:hypothetical protein
LVPALFLWWQSSWSVKLSNHWHLVSRSRISGLLLQASYKLSVHSQSY